jgi:hypothetical protein
VACFGPIQREQYKLVYRDGPRTMYLDTRPPFVGEDRDTGACYLDVTVKQTYEFTTNYDLTRYYMQIGDRKYQPITATGADKDGNVLDL